MLNRTATTFARVAPLTLVALLAACGGGSGGGATGGGGNQGGGGAPPTGCNSLAGATAGFSIGVCQSSSGVSAVSRSEAISVANATAGYTVTPSLPPGIGPGTTFTLATGTTRNNLGGLVTGAAFEGTPTASTVAAVLDFSRATSAVVNANDASQNPLLSTIQNYLHVQFGFWELGTLLTGGVTDGLVGGWVTPITVAATPIATVVNRAFNGVFVGVMYQTPSGSLSTAQGLSATLSMTVNTVGSSTLSLSNWRASAAGIRNIPLAGFGAFTVPLGVNTASNAVTQTTAGTFAAGSAVSATGSRLSGAFYGPPTGPNPYESAGLIQITLADGRVIVGSFGAR